MSLNLVLFLCNLHHNCPSSSDFGQLTHPHLVTVMWSSRWSCPHQYHLIKCSPHSLSNLSISTWYETYETDPMFPMVNSYFHGSSGNILLESCYFKPNPGLFHVLLTWWSPPGFPNDFPSISVALGPWPVIHEENTQPISGECIIRYNPI